jgi:hypothetical protein
MVELASTCENLLPHRTHSERSTGALGVGVRRWRHTISSGQNHATASRFDCGILYEFISCVEFEDGSLQFEPAQIKLSIWLSFGLAHSAPFIAKPKSNVPTSKKISADFIGQFD